MVLHRGNGVTGTYNCYIRNHTNYTQFYCFCINKLLQADHYKCNGGDDLPATVMRGTMDNNMHILLLDEMQVGIAF